MFTNVSPESVGVSSKKVLDYLKRMNAHGIAMHSVIMARGNQIFAESYWKPFHKDFFRS